MLWEASRGAVVREKFGHLSVHERPRPCQAFLGTSIIPFNPGSPFPRVYPPTKQREKSVVFKLMSPIKQAASSTSSSGSKDQLILGALANYAKITGIRLYNNTLADAIGRDYSPEEQPSVFKKFRDGNQRLTNNLNSTMRVLQSFSGVLFEPITDVLTAINLLLSVRPLDTFYPSSPVINER